jgi:hypothetical protein
MGNTGYQGLIHERQKKLMARYYEELTRAGRKPEGKGGMDAH